MILILSAFLSLASARMGYDIYFGLDGFSRQISRSTQEMNFSVDGAVLGEGRFQRYSNIKGFAGIESKESISSPWPSSLKYAEKTFSNKESYGPLLVAS
jgi:hypothetical protein